MSAKETNQHWWQPQPGFSKDGAGVCEGRGCDKQTSGRFAATAVSSPSPPTSTLKHGKILNPVKIIQLHIENVSIENEEIDTKNENNQV
jgi:hypothetical protein